VIFQVLGVGAEDYGHGKTRNWAEHSILIHKPTKLAENVLEVALSSSLESTWLLEGIVSTESNCMLL